MQPKNRRYWLALFLLMAMLSFAAACSSDDDEDLEEEPAEAAGMPYKSNGNEGTITGKVLFDGATAPEPKTIDMAADAACASKNPNAVAEDVVVKNGAVEYVFVYIKDGQTTEGSKKLDSFKWPVSGDATLDQSGCHYVPHMIAVQVGQKLNVTNSDPTTHNVNVQPKNNDPFNQAQGSNAAPITSIFKRAEILIPVKCNQHPWMKAWIGVLKHPFFAVTKEDGSFEIKNVPPGTYTLEAWHEKFGTKTVQVKVDNKGTVTQEFKMGASVASSPQSGSLEIMPALELSMPVGH
ncbi:MAG TPA: carboxypeptidase regulatory-like domain-containing protein [Pyrinomonadaceae bacterium]